MKRWQILKKRKSKSEKLKADEIINILLKNRGLRTEKQVQEFLNPPNPLTLLNSKKLEISKRELNKAVSRIKKAIKSQESIIVYSDFDADGICGAAILWETLNALGAKTMPYIPDRIKEGYGLSKEGIDKVLKEYNAGLIITVDHGITGRREVEYAKKKGIETIITDHHLLPKKLPQALATIHTTLLSGASVAWVLANHLIASQGDTSKVARSVSEGTPRMVEELEARRDSSDSETKCTDHLALAAIGAIADLIPLIGPARSIVKYGLDQLNKTKRIGLNSLFKEAGLEKGKIGTYEVGFIIAPRLNAMGRIEHAIDSLRLLCTKDPFRADSLAQKLGQTNRERQKLMEETTQHAKNQLTRKPANQLTKNLIFISHHSYHEGVIGLVAGKLVEQFYRPSIVVAKGEQYSKASARSINGFNIVKALRTCSDLLVDCGGHPMAAGFTVKTRYLEKVKTKLEKLAAQEISEDLLKKTLKIDCEIKLADVTFSLYEKIAKLAPFGIANPEPVFATRGVAIQDAQLLGKEGKHLKLLVNSISPSFKAAPPLRRTSRMVGGHPKLKDASEVSPAGKELTTLSCIAFNQGHLYPKLSPDKPIDIAYTILLDEWNDQKRLQLKIKDIKI